MIAWEEFWMQTGDTIVLIAGGLTLVSAVVTVIGTVFTLYKNNSISKDAVNRTSEAEKALSTEHEKLATQQTLILERTIDSKTTVQKMADVLNDVDRRMLQAEVEHSKQFLSLDSQQRQLVRSAEDIGKFSEAFLKLATEKSALEQQIQTLRKENADPRRKNATLRQELDQSLDRDEAELGM